MSTTPICFPPTLVTSQGALPTLPAADAPEPISTPRHDIVADKDNGPTLPPDLDSMESAALDPAKKAAGSAAPTSQTGLRESTTECNQFFDVQRRSVEMFLECSEEIRVWPDHRHVGLSNVYLKLVKKVLDRSPAVKKPAVPTSLRINRVVCRTGCNDHQADDNYREEQVAVDLDAVQLLVREGDDLRTLRRFDHRVRFVFEEDAGSFVLWAMDQGYGVLSYDYDDHGDCVVHIAHRGTALLDDLTAHTVAIRRQTIFFDMVYEGWETSVCTRGSEG